VPNTLFGMGEVIAIQDGALSGDAGAVAPFGDLMFVSVDVYHVSWLDTLNAGSASVGAGDG